MRIRFNVFLQYEGMIEVILEIDFTFICDKIKNLNILFIFKRKLLDIQDLNDFFMIENYLNNLIFNLVESLQ